MRFFVFNVARTARHYPLVRPRPNTCMRHSEQRVFIGIDRNHRMTEKAQRLPVTRRATVCKMITELGGTTAIFPSDDQTRRFLARVIAACRLS